MTESINNTMITPGVGSITDSANDVWTISTSKVVQKNNVNVPGGTGTDKVAYVNQNIWGHDDTNLPSKGWYEYISPNWNGPQANIVGTSVIVIPPDTLTVTIAGTSSNGVNPKFIIALGSNGDVAIPPTAVTQNADNVNWQTITFQGSWPSPQTGYLTFINAAPNRELVVKSITFDSNVYVGSSNTVIVLSQQGQSAAFTR